MRGVVLLLAAGRGERLGRGTKGFVELSGVPLVRRAAEAAAAARLVDGIVVAVPPGMEAEAKAVLDGVAIPWNVVTGGETRQASAAAAAAAAEADALVLHDAARALCPSALFDACLEALDDVEAAIVAIALTDTVKRAAGGVVEVTLDREVLVGAQTPQAFRAPVYRRALEAAGRDGFVASDDAGLVERLGVGVRVLPGDESNIKITSELDLVAAEAILRARA